MKKGKQNNTTAIIIVSVLTALIFLSKGSAVLAQNSSIQGEGNLIVETDTINFFSDDITYLKAEIDKLLNECK